MNLNARLEVMLRRRTSAELLYRLIKRKHRTDHNLEILMRCFQSNHVFEAKNFQELAHALERTEYDLSSTGNYFRRHIKTKEIRSYNNMPIKHLKALDCYIILELSNSMLRFSVLLPNGSKFRSSDIKKVL